MIYANFYIHSAPLDTKITLVASGSVEQFPNIHSSLGLSLSTGVHPCNLTLRKRRREDPKFKVTICYRAGFHPAWVI